MSLPWVKSGFEHDAEAALDEIAAQLDANRSSRAQQKVTVPMKLRRNSSNITGTTIGDTNPQDSRPSESGLSLPKKLVSRKRMESVALVIKSTPFGRIYVHTRRFTAENPRRSLLSNQPNQEYEDETTFTYHPVQWLLNWNINLGLEFVSRHTIHGWKNAIRTFRAVSDDNAIFEFCRTGNIQGVKTLLASGRASPLDKNTHGWTPLHVREYEQIQLLMQYILTK
jgi:hypothetical protein